ncbi:MAG: hypothetical protein ACI89E_000586 [Planctomycetota bacterium]|jgi:hypothetical protein
MGRAPAKFKEVPDRVEEVDGLIDSEEGDAQGAEQPSQDEPLKAV